MEADLTVSTGPWGRKSELRSPKPEEKPNRQAENGVKYRPTAGYERLQLRILTVAPLIPDQRCYGEVAVWPWRDSGGVSTGQPDLFGNRGGRNSVRRRNDGAECKGHGQWYCRDDGMQHNADNESLAGRKWRSSPSCAAAVEG